MMIRPMRTSDIDAVRFIDNEAFDQYRTDPIPPRTRANIAASLDLNPEGCFVAELQGVVVGFVFSRTWGQLGWLGTFGIKDGLKGKGIGKRLLDQVVGHLEDRKCEVIGLETMACSPYNIGLYAKYGFRLTEPTLVLIKDIAKTPELAAKPHQEELSPEDVTALSRSVSGILDYGPEAKNALKHGWGQIVRFGDQKLDGFCIVRTEAILQDTAADTLQCFAGVLNTLEREPFASMLGCLEAYGNSLQLQKISLPLNSINQVAIQTALRNGYKVQRASIRMILKGRYDRLQGVDIARWAM